MRLELDPDGSALTVRASSSVHPIRASASGLSGWIEASFGAGGVLDLDRPVRAEVCFPLGRLRSGNPLVDRETERRLDVRRFPDVSGELLSVESSGARGRYHGRGALTFHGVTHEITGSLQLAWSDEELLVDGATTFDVRAFGVQPPRLLMLRVHADVEVHLHARARPV